MNVETGAIYSGDDIEKARQRGEPVVEVSDHVAGLIKLGQARFGSLPTADTTTLEDLKARVEALEGKDALERRMKALGLVMPSGEVK